MRPAYKTLLLISIAFVSGTIAIATMSYNSKSAKIGENKVAVPPSVTVITVGTQNIQSRIAVTGTIVPREEILIGSEAEGLRIISVSADEGDLVKKGDVLALLSADILDAQLAQNRASIAQAKSQIEEAQAALNEAQSSLARTQALRIDGYATQQNLDERIAAERTATARLQSARDGLAVIIAQTRELETRMTHTRITAPVDGLISRRTARIGAIASSAAEPLFRLIAEGDVELEADVPEQFIPTLRIGQDVIIKGEDNQIINGTIRLISPEINATTRLGRIRVETKNDNQLYIGGFGKAEILGARTTHIVVPSQAILSQTDGQAVLKCDGTKVALTSVKTGYRDDKIVVIESGLKQGDEIVLKAGAFLRDGDTINPVKGQ